MTATQPTPVVTNPYPARRRPRGSLAAHYLRTTDPKDIGVLYVVTAFGFFLVGGVMALLIRGELALPGTHFLSPEQYNQLVTMHGTIMLLLYATPILFGFANYIVPLRSTARFAARGPAPTCGTWGSSSPVSARSSARST